MTALFVRDERAADRGRVRAVQEAAFGRPDEARLVDALHASVAPLVSLVAEEGGRLVGHALFSPVAIEGAPAAPACCALGPIGVEPEAQGRGAGAALVRAGLARCRERGFGVAFVLGNPAYYGRFGFGPAAPLGLRYGVDALEPAFQVQELVPGALAGRRGVVRYAEAFRGP
jgi:putative acetyltransferase